MVKTVKKIKARKTATAGKTTRPKRDSVPAAKAKAKTAVKELAVSVWDTQGKAVGKVRLPTELFGARVNKTLLAQAVRVYLANQRQGAASTKTRGEVAGSTRKIYRQKGTGRARHGAIRAPIFVGGGTVFGPQPRSFRLELPAKMRQAALASALTVQYQNGNILAINGLEKLKPKTKTMQAAIASTGISGRILIVVPQMNPTVIRGLRNIPNLTITPLVNLNTYQTLASSKILFTKAALEMLKQKTTKIKSL